MRVEGIIVRTHPSRDADLVLRVVTREAGKVSLLAKHARSSKRRFGSTLDIFDSGTFEVSRGKGTLLLLQGFTPRSAFHRLRSSLEHITTASLVCECFDLLMKEDHAEDSQPIFEALQLGLKAIEESKDVKECLRAAFFSLGHLLQICGFLDQQLAQKEWAQAPSAKNLMRLILHIESSSEREVKTKEAVFGVIDELKKSAA